MKSILSEIYSMKKNQNQSKRSIDGSSKWVSFNALIEGLSQNKKRDIICHKIQVHFLYNFFRLYTIIYYKLYVTQNSLSSKQ